MAWLKLLLGAAGGLFNAVGALFGWLRDRKLVEQGRQEQRDADLATTNRVQKEMIDAAAKRPKSREELEDDLRRGDF